MSNPTPWRTALVPASLLAAVIGWAYLPTLRFLVEKWIDDPQYSHGFLVPFASLYLLRRAWLMGTLTAGKPQLMIGGVLLVGCIVMRWLSGGLMFHQLDAAALLMSISASVLLFGGWSLMRGAWPAILFLIFLVPLPYELERNVGGPLKVVAVEASTYLLQTLGRPAIAEGNLILIDEVRLGVVDACSGLKMLMTFAAFAVGAVLLLDRTKFEKLLVILGIVPIAVIVNVVRITATGIAYTITDDKQTLNLVHDVHGWLMMPAGLALLALQLWTLNNLVLRPAADDREAIPAGAALMFG